MSKEKKWYSFFVSVDDEEAKAAEKKQEEFFKAQPSPSTTPHVSSSSSSVISDELPSFEQIYGSMGIKTPSHGFNIYKIEEMLRSPFLKDMNNEAKKNSILVTLEAIKVSIDEITRDAIKRNRALDSYERFEEQKLQDFENRKSEDNKKIQEDIERYFNEKRENIQRNDKLVQQAKEKFKNWLALKKAEEQKIYETLKYFAPEYSMDSILTAENNKEEEEKNNNQTSSS